MQGRFLHCHHLKVLWAQDDFHNVTQFEIRNRPYWGKPTTQGSAEETRNVVHCLPITAWRVMSGPECVSVGGKRLLGRVIWVQVLDVYSSCWESQLPSTWKPGVGGVGCGKLQALLPEEGSYWSSGKLILGVIPPSRRRWYRRSWLLVQSTQRKLSGLLLHGCTWHSEPVNWKYTQNAWFLRKIQLNKTTQEEI